MTDTFEDANAAAAWKGKEGIAGRETGSAGVHSAGVERFREMAVVVNRALRQENTRASDWAGPCLDIENLLDPELKKRLDICKRCFCSRCGGLGRGYIQ